jgi:prepilin-type N-terminal cleavage/methylation domain-containing protein
MIRLLAAFRRHKETAEDGITLVELLVAMMVLGILLAIIAGLLISSSKVIATTEATGQGTANASNVANELSNVIRSGTNQPVAGQTLASAAFVAASSESLTMYSFVNSYTSSTSTQVRPLLVQFSLNSSRQLVEKRWLPTSTNGTYFIFPTLAQLPSKTPMSTRIIGGPLLATPTTGVNRDPLFVYLNSSGAVVSNPTATPCSIASVRVTVRTQGPTTTSRPAILLVNTVDIPNLPPTGC